MSNILRNRRVITSSSITSGSGGGGTDPVDKLRITNLENNEFKITYFTEINSTADTITIPTGAEILLDQLQGGIDAFVSDIQNNQPTGIFPYTSGGTQVDVSSFNALGNYTLSGTPVLFPVALVYILKIKALDYSNLDITKILDLEETGNQLLDEIQNRIDADILLQDQIDSIPGDIVTQVITGGDTTHSPSSDAIYNNFIINKVSDLSSPNTFDYPNTQAVVDGISSAIDSVIDSAPTGLNTLKEIATAINNDTNFATTISTDLSFKVDKVLGKGLSEEDYTTLEKTKLSGISGTNTGDETQATILSKIGPLGVTDTYIASAANWNAKGTIKGIVSNTNAIPYQNGTLDTLTDTSNMVFSPTTTCVNIGTSTSDFLFSNRSSIHLTDSVTSSVRISLQNKNSSGSSGLVMGQGTTSSNYSYFVRFNSSFASNYPGTSIPYANLTIFSAGGSSAEGNGAFSINGNPIYQLIGQTSTNCGTRLDSIGLRIGKLSNVNTINTAQLTIGAGTATASTAPLKFTSGTNLTTPENGAVEFDGTNYFVTSGGIRYTLAKTLTTTASLNFPSTAAGASSDLTVSLTGASDGDTVILGIPSASVVTNGLWQSFVSSANTITIRFINNDDISALDPATGTFRVTILKY